MAVTVLAATDQPTRADTPSTLFQRRLLGGLAATLVVLVTTTALYVLGG